MTWPEGETHGGPSSIVVRLANPDAPPVGGLSSTVLRAIDFRDASAQLRRQLAVGEHRRKSGEQYEAKRMDLLRDQLAKGLSDKYLALLSSNYVLRVNTGQPKPVEYLAEQLGKSTQTVRGHLWKARNRGFLTSSQGRNGGKLSPEASAIIKQIAPSGLESLGDTYRRLGKSP